VTVCRLTAVSPYGAFGSSSRVRLLDWITHIRKDHHLEVDDYHYLGTSNLSAATVLRQLRRVPAAEARLRRLARHRSSATRLVMSREATPFSAGGIEARLLKCAEWAVYDFDDAMWADRRGGIHHVFAKPRKWRRAVEAADCVIAGNEYLANAAESLNRNVVVIPSCVEPADYPRKVSYDLPERPTFVWLGSPSTEVHLTSIAVPLLQLNRRRGAKLKLISAGDRSLGALDLMIERVEWTPDGFAAELAAADIGLAPLHDDEFARGKCAYKSVQYGAAALPIVGSPVGTNRHVIDALGGLTPTSVSEWTSALEAVLDDTASGRAKRGSLARRAVECEYSFTAWSTAWREATGISTKPNASEGRCHENRSVDEHW
jgi:hypothetical protein